MKGEAKDEHVTLFPMKIILMGYRGSGKTSVGRVLARAWKTVYVDVDDQCCERFGMDSVAAIWARHGEPAWRAVECEVTGALCAGQDDRVVGLGGGTLMQPAARQAVEKAVPARRIYLWASVELLYERIQGDPRSAQTRPALTAQGGGIEEIRTVLEHRDPVYRAVADDVIDVSGKSVDTLAAEILERLQQASVAESV